MKNDEAQVLIYSIMKMEDNAKAYDDMKLTFSSVLQKTVYEKFESCNCKMQREIC